MGVDKLENHESVFETPQELVRSYAFQKGIKIILKQVNKDSKRFDETYLLSIFEKLSMYHLDDDETSTLISFFRDEEVEKKGKELLLKLRGAFDISKIKKDDRYPDFHDFLQGLLAEDGYKRIKHYIADMSSHLMDILIENKYEGYITVVFKHGPEEYIEFHIEKENSKVDSSNWEKIVNKEGIPLLVNQKGDAFEYLDGEFKGQQFFSNNGAIEREFQVDMSQYQGSILKKILKKYDQEGRLEDLLHGKYPGMIFQDNFLTGEKGRFAYYPMSSVERDSVPCLGIESRGNGVFELNIHKNNLLSFRRLVKGKVLKIKNDTDK